MLYAYFTADGAIDRAAMHRQVEACVRNGVHGLAVLGLATEAAKLAAPERHRMVEWVAEDLAGRLPLAVTVSGDSVDEQVAFGRYAKACGASWVILQPPRMPDAGDAQLVTFFGAVMERLDMTVAVQNAPEYIGIGLTPAGIVQLARAHGNFTVLKGEGPVLLIKRVIEETEGKIAVFNGRAGLELTDNLRAGCAGMIPGVDFMDCQARVFELMRAGNDREAETVYREILPGIVFVMQSVEHLVCYGKRIAALRLGVETVRDRAPALAPETFGLECVRRYAAQLGPFA